MAEMLRPEDADDAPRGLLDMLLQVRHLLMACTCDLKKLRLVCRPLRVAVSAEITSLIVDLEEPAFSDSLSNLSEFLSSCGCKLRYFGVILPVNCLTEAQLECRLTDLVTMLNVSLNHVSSIKITLTMDDTSSPTLHSHGRLHQPNSTGYNHRVEALPAIAVMVLSPVCGALTSLTVTNKLPYSKPLHRQSCNLLPLFQSLHDASADLTLLSLTMSFSAGSVEALQGAHTHSPEDKHSNNNTRQMRLFDCRINATAEDVHNNTKACSLCRGFKALISLSVDGGCMGGEGWNALPDSLKQLKLYCVHAQPLDTLSMLHLKQLVLTTCECSLLVQLLHELPNVTTIVLNWLIVNGCTTQRITDLSFIFTQSVINPVQQQSTNIALRAQRVCVKGLDLRASQPCEILMSEFLTTIPVMSTVIDCNISFLSEDYPGHHFLDDGEACLRHLPRVLPSLKNLTIVEFITQAGPLAEEVVLALDLLKLLQRLKLVTKSGVSWDQIQGWKVMLPKIVDWEVSTEVE